MKKLFAWLILTLLSTNLNAADASDVTKKTAAECRSRLEKIYSAIQEYRIEHKKLPAYFSDLVPKFIPDKKLFLCPEEERSETKQRRAPWRSQFQEQSLPSDYIYEFSAHPVSGSLASGGMTMAEWKAMQLAVVGGTVPIIRCHSHVPFLNISFDGKFFESRQAWELEVTNKVNRAELTPTALRARFQSREGEGSQKK